MPQSLTLRERRILLEEQRLLERAAALLPGAKVPYFAHLRIESGGRATDLLLGAVTRKGPGLWLIDWERSPLSELFFSYDQGEAYELGTGGHLLRGVVLRRARVSFERGELVEITSGDTRLSRRGASCWRRVPEAPGIGLRMARSPSGDLELDRPQQRIVGLPPREAVLVLGEAGHGKTTVALHRLARLMRDAGQRLRAAVIVPTEGLRRLIETLLQPFGLPVEVALYDRWAERQARRVFVDLPRRESQDAAAGVVTLKRHPALRAALAELALAPPSLKEGDSGPRPRALATHGDLHHLFGDSALMKKAAAASASALTPVMVAETLEHTRVQFCETAEEEYSHVDPERLLTLDRRTLDDGTPMEDAGTIDPEDYAVLFELDRLRSCLRGVPPTAPRQYDCLVVDEAQELAPLELALIGRSLAPDGTIIIAGDADQQVDPSACFEGWERAMAEIGCREYRTAVLETGYRCPPSVAALSRRIVEPDSEASPSPLPSDPSVLWVEHDNPCHLAAWLIDGLRALRERDRRPSVAVIARAPESARRLAAQLNLGVGARLVLDGSFAFRGAINVTCVQQIKGLEFDCVIIPDASESSYPETPQSRRALYTAVTRARRKLVLATAGGWTPLLGPTPHPIIGR